MYYPIRPQMHDELLVFALLAQFSKIYLLLALCC